MPTTNLPFDNNEEIGKKKEERKRILIHPTPKATGHLQSLSLIFHSARTTGRVRLVNSACGISPHLYVMCKIKLNIINRVNCLDFVHEGNREFPNFMLFIKQNCSISFCTKN
jgi:hypothetical protein